MNQKVHSHHFEIKPTQITLLPPLLTLEMPLSEKHMTSISSPSLPLIVESNQVKQIHQASSSAQSIFSFLSNQSNQTPAEKCNTSSLLSQNLGNLATSLSLNLNLPPSVSSILFQKTNNSLTDKKSLLPGINKNDVEVKPPERPTDPRLQSTFKPTKRESTAETESTQSQIVRAKTLNPVFNKIQNILTNGVKPLTCNYAPKNTPKNRYITAENKNFTIKRSKPLETFEDTAENVIKSKLVELHEKEKPLKENDAPVMTLNSNRKNTPLQKIFLQRNNKKMDQLTNVYEKQKCNETISEMFEDFKSENDLVNSLNHLMNYDFCKNKFNPNELSRKKKKKKENPSIKIDLFDIDFVSTNETATKSDIPTQTNDSEDILYNDIEDFGHNLELTAQLTEETSRPAGELELELTFHEDGELLESVGGVVDVNKREIKSAEVSPLRLNKLKENCNKITSRETKQDRNLKEKPNNNNNGYYRSSSPRNKRRSDEKSIDRSSRSGSSKKSENLRRSRSRSRSRKRDQNSRLDYSTKRGTTDSHSSKNRYDNYNRDRNKPLNHSQEANKNCKRKRYD